MGFRNFVFGGLFLLPVRSLLDWDWQLAAGFRSRQKRCVEVIELRGDELRKFGLGGVIKGEVDCLAGSCHLCGSAAS